MKILVTGLRGIPDIQGGVETHCGELYPRLAAKGYRITVAYRLPYFRTRLTTYEGVKLAGLPAPRIKALEAFVHSLLSVFYAAFTGCRAVHIHAVGPSLLIPLARLLGMKVIMTHHGGDYNREKWGCISRFLLKAGELFAAAFANRIIAVSQGIRQMLIRKYGRSDAVLIYNGIQTRKRVQSFSYPQSLGLEKNRYLLAVGRLVPEKGFHDLINAYSIMNNRKIRLVIAGEENRETVYGRTLKKLAHDRGCVLTGYIKGKKLAELYSHTALFILPSHHEGFPIVLLEALSYDLNVVVSDIPPNREFDLPEYCYFRAGDPEDCARTVINALNENRNIPYTALYNWETVADKTGSLYEELFQMPIGPVSKGGRL
ncbi:MAG: glycosyltransferase family 4 protein [Spirochaetales bacterium]|nr:glycosyltransferase family 4 protein [Spirochaetales bacterium]